MSENFSETTINTKIDKEKINLYNAFRINENAVMSRLNCHNIGKIVEFDADTQLCSVELMQVKRFNEKSYHPAVITQIPLIIYGANNGHITLPNPVGTICLVLFLDRDISNFILTGEQYAPDTTRMHDFTDCVALTTFKTLVNPLENYDLRAVHIFNKETIEGIIYNSFIKVYGNQILMNSTSSGEDGSTSTISLNPTSLTINTTDTTLNSQDTISFTTKKYTNDTDTITNTADTSITNKTDLGAQVELTALVNIQNTAQNLAVLMETLISTIQAITIEDSQVSTASKAALEVVKTHFAELLI